MTYKRGRSEPPVIVYRKVGEFDDTVLAYCGECFQRERHEPEPADDYWLLLGDSKATDRTERLYLVVAGSS